MNFYIYIYLDGQNPTLCAQAIWEKELFKFRYEKSYLDREDFVALDPIYYPKTDQPIIHQKIEGCLRDTTPDQWGRKLMDTVTGRVLNEWEFLLATDEHRLGDLAFSTKRNTISPLKPWSIKKRKKLVLEVTLDELTAEFEQIESLELIDDYVKEIISKYASMGGSRPKANFIFQNKICLAKFELTNESFDNPRAEYATMTLAKKCGITVPWMKLVTARNKDVFLIQRFDRATEQETQRRTGFASGVTMTGNEEGSYEDLVTVIKRHAPPGAAKTQAQQLYRRMIFNILVHNIDDHLRNHGFTRSGPYWNLSPAYDIVASTTNSESHAIEIGNDGYKGSLKNALSVCEKFFLSKEEANELITELSEITRDWREHFLSHGISASKIESYSNAFKVKP